MRTRIAALIVYLSMVILMGGCTSLKTFPHMARAGDTITLAVGSPDGMNRSNTTVVFEYDDDGNRVDLTPHVRSIFKLHADPTSSIFRKVTGQPSNLDIPSIIQTSGHAPWVSIIALDLPTTMTPGTGQVLVNTAAGYPGVVSHINDLQINGKRIELEVLPGTGMPTIFKYEFGVGHEFTGDLTRLEPAPHAMVHPLFEGGGGIAPHPYQRYGAIEIHLDLYTDVPITGEDIYLAPEDMESMSDSRRSIAYGINNNGINPHMTVILTSPIGQLEYYEARFSLVPQEGVTFTSAPVVKSVDYYDTNGNPASGPAASTYIVTLN